jgi:hypothetical protein
LGRPALLPSYEHEIDVSRLVGLRGPYCAYLWRVLDSPEEREVDIVIGNNDAYRLYLNGEKAAEVDESVWWAPFNNVHRVHLKAGPNRLLLKLVKRGDELRFTFGLRAAGALHQGFNANDWIIDTADR